MLKATSENLVFCRERGHDARIFQEDAGEPPAFPGVFGACLKIIREGKEHNADAGS